MNKRPYWFLLFLLSTGCALDPKMCKPGEREVHVMNYWTYGTNLIVLADNITTNLPFSSTFVLVQKMDAQHMVPAITVTAWKDEMLVSTNIPAEKLDTYFQSRQVRVLVVEVGNHLYLK